MTTNQAATTQGFVIPTELVEQGKALATEWDSICKADKKRMTTSLKEDGFDTKLGALLDKLDLEAATHNLQGKAKAALLSEAGLGNIDRRRRSEALWFHRNRDEVTAWMKANGKSINSLTAMQSAFNKAQKKDDDAKPEASKPEPKEAEPKAETSKEELMEVNAVNLAKSILKVAADSQMVEDVILLLQASLEAAGKRNDDVAESQVIAA
mgnify:CR=1 FL=1